MNATKKSNSSKKERMHANNGYTNRMPCGTKANNNCIAADSNNQHKSLHNPHFSKHKCHPHTMHPHPCNHPISNSKCHSLPNHEYHPPYSLPLISIPKT